MILGTNLVCSEVFFCAYLVGQGTNEQVFLKQTQPWTGKKKKEVVTRRTSNFQNAGSKPKNSCIYSIQPGSQVLGDQVFDALAYCDNQDPLEDYTTSWRGQLPPSEFAV
ncbi:uncharacterized protein K441DRAFT_89472 [Cenococcum geophilum 1.58]|uniref:uncharacterized protein n=1 Tax=Cenococcum geophilum 1.58 TaxID=794803 RepID=UPI00358F079F|nr:hypothetical protein K441DRAFT_89472 [Cenococcum geophilum 1.58]